MPNAIRSLPIIVLIAAGLAACGGEQNPDQNVVITSNIPEGADVEALPPDESVGTPTDQLENGDDNADVAELNSNDND